MKQWDFNNIDQSLYIAIIIFLSKNKKINKSDNINQLANHSLENQ